MTSICCIFNVAAHYRSLIYHLIDQELQADFYIGDTVGRLERMEYSTLKGYKGTLKNMKCAFSPLNWQHSAVRLSCKPYQHYILTGDFYCVSTWCILLLCRLMNKRTYLWTHGWYGREGLMKKWMKKIFFGLATEVLLYGEYARHLMVKEGFDSGKLHVIANSLDYDKQLMIRQGLKQTNIFREHFKNENPILIFVGRLTKVKKLDLLINACYKLHEEGRFVNLVLVGDEMEEFSVRELLLKKNILSKIWIYGACYDEEKLGELFYNADVCVSPGNVGLTAVHALTYGCPVITHGNFSRQMPEFEVIENGRNGLFFKENDLDALTESIKVWLDYARDKRKTIRESCYEIIDNKFNPHYQIELLKRIIK